MGNSHTLGERGGEQNHTLIIQEIPSHTHQPSASNVAGSSNLPAIELLGNASPNLLYGAVQDTTALRSSVVATVGGSQAHPNMQPFLTLSFCIALQGIFPSQN
jgi:microcystin-dependent protein